MLDVLRDDPELQHALSIAEKPLPRSAEMIAAIDFVVQRERGSALAVARMNSEPISMRAARRISALMRASDSVRWLMEHFEDLPAKLKKNLKAELDGEKT